MAMIIPYTCQTCGYTQAVWRIILTTSELNLCETCVQEHSSHDSHIGKFLLNRENRIRRRL